MLDKIMNTPVQHKPKIIVHSEVSAENNAMLQALYSRSAASVEDHLKKLEATGSANFMSQYYRGYGHGSIGECGSETVYFEGISMLAAKAIEDNPLYVGQECSSRYIDFSTQHFYNSYEGTPLSSQVEQAYEHYRSFYTKSLEPLKASLKLRYPKQEGVTDGIYEKTIAARAFDILRGFLPVGATTNVAWTGSLRTLGEHLIWMMHHPLKEVAILGVEAYTKLYEKHPNSFHEKYCLTASCNFLREELIEAEGEESQLFQSMLSNFYDNSWNTRVSKEKALAPVLVDRNTTGISKYCYNTISPYTNRPKYNKLPKHSAAAWDIVRICTVLDFGSFRDIQRHRNGYCSMPIITAKYGIHEWYYTNLPEELQAKANSLLDDVRKIYNLLTPEDGNTLARIQAQYVLPMGTLVDVDLQYSVAQCVYVAELRSSKTVHPTLRPLAQCLGEYLETELELKLYYDKEESDWTVKRGEQDIVAKQTY